MSVSATVNTEACPGFQMPRVNWADLKARLYLAACNPLVNQLMGIAGGLTLVALMKVLPDPATFFQDFGHTLNGLNNFQQPDFAPVALPQESTPVPLATPSCEISSPLIIQSGDSVSAVLEPELTRNGVPEALQGRILKAVCHNISEEIPNCDLVQPGAEIHLPKNLCQMIQHPEEEIATLAPYNPDKPPAPIESMADVKASNLLSENNMIACGVFGYVSTIVSIGMGFFKSRRKQRS